MHDEVVNVMAVHDEAMRMGKLSAGVHGVTCPA
jgi:hypothetical protein